MKISGRKPSVTPTSSVGGAARSADTQKEAVATPLSGADDVELSSSLKEIDRAKEALAALPDVRVEKVNEIKPRVDDGSYQVESEALAKKMVDASLRESAQANESGKK